MHVSSLPFCLKPRPLLEPGLQTLKVFLLQFSDLAASGFDF